MVRPVVETKITQHTLWQAIAGSAPPFDLVATPIVKAVLDNRDVTAGDLFIAFSGRFSDGNRYVGAALKAGAKAIICQKQGKELAQAAGAYIVDCRTETTVTQRADITKSRSTVAPSDAKKIGSAIAYVVDDSQAALQQVGAFQRLHRTHAALRVIGITGSIGKSSTKELAAALLRQRYRTFHNPGNLNSEQGLPLSLLGLGFEERRAILEMGMYDIGEIAELCTWARPQVGLITNVGPVHLERLGTIERIQQAKAELVKALPTAEQGGVAILNWDDERVRSMQTMTDARIFRYGLSPDADLWADEVESAGREGIRFCFHHADKEWRVNLPLLGRHSVYTALSAAAIGVVEGVSWDEIVAGLQNFKNPLRLVMTPGINHSTIIDDTYNASPASTIAALDLLDDLSLKDSGRKIAVLGDMLELGDYTKEGHRLVGQRSADVVDRLITVGKLGRSIGVEAVAAGLSTLRLHSFDNHVDTVEFLTQEIQADDIVLVKGSRAVGMETIASKIRNAGDEYDNKPLYTEGKA